jgi:hypothetical protein
MSDMLRAESLTFYEGVSKNFRTESNEINNSNNNKHSLINNTKDYSGRTHYTDSQHSDTTAPSGKELYQLQFPLQAASPETFGYVLVFQMYLSIIKRRTALEPILLHTQLVSGASF